MFRMVMLLLVLSIGSAATAQQEPTPASITVAPEARDLFERDWVLMNLSLIHI